MKAFRPQTVLIAAILLAGAAPVHGEVIEEIVAKVNDDIITKTEFEQEEQALIAELYRRYTGKELDDRVKDAKAGLLRNMIDRKLLIHRAERLYDREKMESLLIDLFMEQEKIKDQAGLDRLLEQNGMTIEDLKRRLVGMYAPEEVIRFEVSDRLAVGDREVGSYYDSHPDEFRVPGTVALREIVLLAGDGKKEERRDEAREVMERAASEDADFAELAREVSEAGTAEAGGLIGPFEKGELVVELEEAAFTLPVGTVSEPIETQHGFHIIRVESRTEDRMRPLQEVREQLRNMLADRKFEKALKEFLERARAEATIEVQPKYRDRYARKGP